MNIAMRPQVPLGEFMLKGGGSTDPAKQPDEKFVLYSIPAFDGGTPEIVKGREIGSPKKNVETGDILLSRIVPHIRRSWIVGRHGNEKLVASGEWIVFRSPKIHGPYLRNFLVSDTFHPQFMGTVAGVGGSLLRANPNRVANITIPVPSLDEQRRIAAILDKADAMRRKRKRALDLLDSLTQSIFMEMFGEEILHGAESRLRRIGDLAALQNGAYYPSELYTTSKDGTEMVHMSDAFYGTVKRGNLKRVNCAASDNEKYCLLPSDLIIARRSLTIEGAAKPCLIPNAQDPLIYESSFIRVRTDPAVINAMYLYHYLSHPFVRQKHLNPYITQSTISGINQSNLGKVRVFVPSMPEQRKFLAVAMRLKQEQGKVLDLLVRNDALFSSLQSRAFSGQL